MSQHRSLRAAGGGGDLNKSVLKRFERIKLLKKRGQWKEGKSPIGLPKTKPER
ncbi:MAG: small basic protein [Verrucomicrobiota bacterium]